MVNVFEVRGVEELGDLATAWQHLWSRTPHRSFFQSLDWLLVYWRHFGQGQQLRVLVAEEDNEIQGILPLVLRREQTRGGKFRVLTYPLADWGNFYGPIGPRTADTLTGCLTYLQQQPRDWDLLDFRWVDQHEVDRGDTPAAMADAGFPCAEYTWRETAILDFVGSWDSYLASRCAKFRSNLRRAETAAAAGDVSFHRYRPDPATENGREPRWDFFDDCLDLAARSWQGSSPSGTTLSHPEVTGFFRELFGVAAQAGAIDINMLRQEGRLIAFSYNLVCDGRLEGLRIGFDREASHVSPGRLLLARSVADSFQRGDSRLDLGSETMDFKRPWLTRTVPSMRYIHYPRTSLKSQLLRMKHVLSR